jgi:hypothetical protein
MMYLYSLEELIPFEEGGAIQFRKPRTDLLTERYDVGDLLPPMSAAAAPASSLASSGASRTNAQARLRDLFPPPVRAQVESQAGPLWDRPAGVEVPIGRALELVGMSPRLHIPGLGGLSQGPGFANLGALGLLSNRVLQPLLREKPSTQGFGAGDSLQYKSLSFE